MNLILIMKIIIFIINILLLFILQKNKQKKILKL